MCQVLVSWFLCISLHVASFVDEGTEAWKPGKSVALMSLLVPTWIQFLTRPYILVLNNHSSTIVCVCPPLSGSRLGGNFAHRDIGWGLWSQFWMLYLGDGATASVGEARNAVLWTPLRQEPSPHCEAGRDAYIPCHSPAELQREMLLKAGVSLSHAVRLLYLLYVWPQFSLCVYF